MGATSLAFLLFCATTVAVHGSHYVDLALRKPAMQIDTAYGGLASRANDGNTNGNYGAKHCSHTNANAKDKKKNNWWAVDLQKQAMIAKVVVFNRADCCGNRLANFDIVVTNRRPVPGRRLFYGRNQVCAHKRGAIPQGRHQAFACRRRGRYVAIVRSRALWLTLCGVQVLGRTGRRPVRRPAGHYVDLALRKPAMQIDTAYGGLASRANDGNTNGNYGAKHCSHTNANAKDKKKNNWWAVDLQKQAMIAKVVVFNRADCCGNRLANFDIVVTNRRPVPGRRLFYGRNQVCAHKRGAIPQGRHQAFACRRRGRYVAIVRSRALWLTLCGVQVLGRTGRRPVRRPAGHYVDLALRKPAMQIDTAYGGLASRANDGNTNGNYGAKHCSHTNANAKDKKKNNWWAVDLQKQAMIAKVVVFNRADCCGNRLANFDIVVTNKRPVPGHRLFYGRNQVCAHKRGAIPQGRHQAFACRRRGRYVAIVRSRALWLTLCGVQVFGRGGRRVGHRVRHITFYLRKRRYIFKLYNVYSKLLFRWRRGCLPGSRNFPKRRGNCRIFNIGIFRKWLLRYGGRLFHLNFVGRFRYARQLKFSFRLGGWLNLRWFRHLTKCPFGTRRYGPRCRVTNFNLYRNWLRRNGRKFGISLRRYKWIRGYKFRFYKLLRLNFRRGGWFRLKWFRGLRRCLPGTKRYGARCKVFNLRLVRRWMRRHGRRFHINLGRISRVPTLLHHFRFNGRMRGQWAIKLHGRAKFFKKQYLYLPGTRGSFASFRRIPFKSSFTIGFYVKPLRVNGRQTLIGSWVRNRWLYKFNLINGRLSLWLRRGPNPAANLVAVGHSGRLVANRWYHVAFTWNAHTRWARIFINGRQVGARKSNTPRTVKLYANPAWTAIGYKQDSNNENFKGYLTGLRISRGVISRRRFVILAKRIKNFHLHLGGFKFIKYLRRNLRIGGRIYLRWFRYGRFRLKKCPRGTRRQGRRRGGGYACRIYRLSLFYHWLRRHGPRFHLNLNMLPKPRFYHFAKGTKLMRLFVGYHALGGRAIEGLFTSLRCRAWCARRRACRAVDYNGQTRRCYYHNRPYRRIRATRKTSGVKQVWKIGQYAKRPRHRGPRYYVRGFGHRYGDCPGHNIAHYKRTNVKFCAHQCRVRRNCRTFLFVAHGSTSYCYLKNNVCKRLRSRNHKNYHFYNKRGGFPYWRLLRKNFRKGGVIHLSWFRLKRCPGGTKVVGRSFLCRVFNLRFFRRWIRRNARRFKINLRRFPHVNRLYHIYLFRRRPTHPRWRMILRGGVKYSIPSSLYFPGRRGAYALGNRFPKHRRSFTISFYFKTPTVAHRQTLIGNWAPRRWQYLFRIWNGGKLGLYLRRNKFNTGSDPRQDMIHRGVTGGRVVPNRWHHTGFSWNHKTGVARIYLDGRIVATRKTGYPDRNLFAHPYPKFQLGYKMDSKNENFKGKIARLRFSRGVLPLRRFVLFARRFKPGKHHGGHLVDLALRKPAMQIDTAYGGLASRANDGNTNGNYFAKHCSHTNANAKDKKNNNWWAVDLRSRASVQKVVVFNRADCCGNRLANFDIVVTNRRPVVGRRLLYSKSQVCAHKRGAIPQGRHQAFACRRRGRYVAIVRSRALWLTLCGVKVFGTRGRGGLHFGGFRFTLKLHKALRYGGRLNLRWFRFHKKYPRRCPKGSRWHRGRGGNKNHCYIFNLHWIYRWLRRQAPRYKINIRRLPKMRYFRFAPPRGRMRLYRQRHSMGGKRLPGRYNSARCRNYCAAHRNCRAVDYNGAKHLCFLHTRYRRLRPATPKSTGTRKYWTVGQYRKIAPRPARYKIRNYSHRFGDCAGRNIRKFSRASRKTCVGQCNRRKNCKSFIYVSRGSNSYCILKNSYCRHLRSRNHKNYHFYTKRIHRFKFGLIFRKQTRKGGVINLRWFHGLRRCMRGTKRIGRSFKCRVFNVRFLLRWIRRHHKRYHFNLARFPHVPRTYHVFYFNGRHHLKRWRIRRRGVKIIKRKFLYFPGKRNTYALGPRFNKYRGSFTISFFFKPKTVSRNQVLIAQWGPKQWQYIFRLQKGGRLSLQLRRDRFNTGSNPKQDMLPGGAVGGKVLPNRWYYVGLSWNHHTGVARIYLNGKVVATKKTRYPDHKLFHNPFHLFQLGYKKDSNSENFFGYMAALRFTRGVMPRRRFVRYTKAIKGIKLHFGGFKFIKLLRKSLRYRGIFRLRWFRHGKHVLKRCPRGSRRVGHGKKNIRCKIYRLRWIYGWLRKYGPRYRINVGKLPHIRYYRFAPGNKIMKLYRQMHSRNGKPLRGKFTSRGCRNWCQRHACWAVDYNGANTKCYVHRKPKRRYGLRGVKFFWKIGQYVKRKFTPAAKYHLKSYRHRIGDCVGHDIGAFSRTNLRYCARQCSIRAACRSFLFRANGSNSKCWIKRYSKKCIGRLTRRNRRNFHFYNKRAPRAHFRFGKLLRKNMRKGGVFLLKWFPKLKKCMWGTKRAGAGCKVFHLNLFKRWLRVHYKRYHINIHRFPHISWLYHNYIFKHGVKPRRFRIFRHPGVTYRRFPKKHTRLYALNFPGKRGAFALAPRFNKYRGSFTIGFYFKPRTVANNQILIGNWAPKRWQYLFRLIKGGRLGFYLRRDKYNTGSNPKQDMVSVVGGKVAPNKWNYGGFSWNHRTGVARIYLNGRVVATKKTKYPDHNLFHNPYPKFQLGYNMGTKSEFYNGLIANLRFSRGIVSIRTFKRFFQFIKHIKQKPSGFPKKYFKLLLQQVRPGGVIHLRWFKRKHCFPGTVKVGKTCRIRRIRLFIRWLRRTGPKFKINLGKLPLNRVWPLRPAGKIYGHPWYLLFRQPRPSGSKGIKKVKGPFGSKQPGYYFPGRPNAYFKIPNHGHLHFKSFTIFAWIKQNGIKNGAIVEYSGYKNKGAGTHFWIWGNTLFVNLIHNNGRSYIVSFPKFKGMFPKNKWSFVGVSYNHKTGDLVMWINGRTYYRKAPRVTPDTVGPVYVGVRPKNKKFSPFKGTLSGVSILPFAIARTKVIKFVHYYIKLSGGKAPAGFFKVPAKPKPPKPVPVCLKSGIFETRPFYDLFGIKPTKKNSPARGLGPFGSRLPSYYFPGKPNVFFKAPSCGKLHRKSITIFSFIKQKRIQDGPIVEWGGPKKIGTHFWIFKDKLFVNLVHNNGKYVPVFFNLKGGIPAGKWNFVAMIYNHKSGVLVMIINGNTYKKNVGKFTLDTVGDVYVGTRPSNHRSSPFKGYLAGTVLLPYAVPLSQLNRFRAEVMEHYYHVSSLPKGFWWKVGYKPKPVAQKPKPAKKPATKPAPTKLSKENLKKGGTFDLKSVFHGLSACPKGTKTVGNNCIIYDYQIFIIWLKANAQRYHIDLKRLPIVYTTTTTTTMHFSKGQQFDIEMFRGKCPTGTKTVGKHCEVTNADTFLAWLKVNAHSYGIDFSVHEAPADQGAYTTTSETQTTQSGGGYANGQAFPKQYFRGKCVSGTTAKGTNCVVSNGNLFAAWLAKNGKAYGLTHSSK